MNLIGALPDLRDLGIPHEPFGSVVLAVAVATVKLDAFGGHLHGEVSGAEFRNRGLHPHVLLAAVDEIGHIVDPALDHEKLAGEIGHRELVALEVEHLLAALGALVGVIHHVLEGRAGDATGMSCHRGARFVQGGEQDLQPVAGLTQQVLAWHADVVEGQCAGRRAVVAHLFLFREHLEARAALLKY
jgi:hypothetical protein